MDITPLLSPGEIQALELLNPEVTQGRRNMINRFNRLNYKLVLLSEVQFDNAVLHYISITGINLHFDLWNPRVSPKVRGAFLYARGRIEDAFNLDPRRDEEELNLNELEWDDPILRIGLLLEYIDRFKTLRLDRLSTWEAAINRAEIAVEQFEIAVGLKTRTGRSVQRKKIKRKK